MAHAFDDLTGRTFGRLNVVRFDHFDRHGVSYYWVQCECGAPPKIVQRCNFIRVEPCHAIAGDSNNRRHGAEKVRFLDTVDVVPERIAMTTKRGRGKTTYGYHKN